MKARLLGPAILVLFVGLPPSAAHAARCSDFPNQAAAQRAANTIDLDGDGIYCERLPCPCARPGAAPPPGPQGPPAPPRPAPRPGPTRPAQTFRAVILTVIDGDTLRVRLPTRQVRTVRLVGIDTPERGQCGHVAAGAHLRRFSPPGTRVILTTDPTQASYDRFRRLLAYVRSARGILQITQLRNGWARVFIFQNRPFRYAPTFQAHEANAKARAAGIWGPCVR